MLSIGLLHPSWRQKSLFRRCLYWYVWPVHFQGKRGSGHRLKTSLSGLRWQESTELCGHKSQQELNFNHHPNTASMLKGIVGFKAESSPQVKKRLIGSSFGKLTKFQCSGWMQYPPACTQVQSGLYSPQLFSRNSHPTNNTFLKLSGTLERRITSMGQRKEGPNTHSDETR